MSKELPEPVTLRWIAEHLDPWQCQMAVAQALKVLNSQWEWDSDTNEAIGRVIGEVDVPEGLPFYDEFDENGYECDDVETWWIGVW